MPRFHAVVDLRRAHHRAAIRSTPCPACGRPAGVACDLLGLEPADLVAEELGEPRIRSDPRRPGALHLARHRAWMTPSVVRRVGAGAWGR